MSDAASTPTLIGSPASPYVRKIMAVADAKGLTYRIDPIVGFMGSEDFGEISPLRRIPVWIDDQVTLADSSVIAQYLEDRYPSPALFPADIAARAKARWIEEYCDTRFGQVSVFKLFFQRVVAPFVMGKPTDEAVVAQAMTEDMPDICGYLEGQLPAEGFFFGDLSIADLTAAAFFFNARVAGFELDAARWPKLADWLARAESETPLARLNRVSAKLLKAPPAEHRAVLEGLGYAPSERTWQGDRPRRGPLSAV